MPTRDQGTTVEQFIIKAFWLLVSGVFSFTTLKVSNTLDELKKANEGVKEMVFNQNRVLSGISAHMDSQDLRLSGHDRLLNTLYKFEFKKNLENKPIHKED